MDSLHNSLFQLIQYSLWGGDPTEVDDQVYLEMKAHSIITLPAIALSKLSMSNNLREAWEKSIYTQIAYNVRSKKLQDNLPITVPYVVLKGTSAAKYYPSVICRTMGDIDIMARREDYETACNMLLENGFHEKTSTHMGDFGRHRSFSKDGVVVEVHSFFSLLNDIEQAEFLDNLIIDSINDTHVLPEPINGLVILEHISQHLEGGIGLRQIIDWMMFVDKCLPNEKWPEFQIMVQRIGLEPFAIVLTRMCELYLGLSTREWSVQADEVMCEQLMDYILSCGNFGAKRSKDDDIVTNVFVTARTPMSMIRLMQERGLANWKSAQRCAVLRPFAWIYQLFRYLTRGLGRKDAPVKLKMEYKEAQQRKEMFDALGVRQNAKGNAVYKDGRYKMTFKRP